MFFPLKMSAVKSNGKPYVSYNLNAIDPGKVLFFELCLNFHLIFSFHVQAEKNFSSSFFNVSTINSLAFINSG